MAFNQHTGELFDKVFEELVENFSGKKFTIGDLRSHYFPDPNAAPKKKKGAKKKSKMTVRKYIMQNAEWKKKINAKKDTGEEKNFIKVTSIIMEEMSDEERETLQKVVDEVNGVGGAEDEN